MQNCELSVTEIGSVKGRMKNTYIDLDRAIEDVKSILDSEFPKDAPFQGINLLISYSTKTNLIPLYRGIKKGYLNVEVEVEMKRISQTQQIPPRHDELYLILKLALLEVLVAVGEKYELSFEKITLERDEVLSNWPYEPLSNSVSEESVNGTERNDAQGKEDVPLSPPMIKLVKGTMYWEVWEEEHSLVVHEGIVGHCGETRKVKVKQNQDVTATMLSLSNEMRKEGFHDLDNRNLEEISIEYQIDGFGTEGDLSKRHYIEDWMNDCLGWTGNGLCEGGDIGSGGMTIYCSVIDIEKAIETILAALDSEGYLEGAIIQHLDRKSDDFIIVYPEGASYLA